MINFFKKKKILVTHSGSFHGDDVFACAALSLLMDKRKTPFKVIRTRDKEIIEKGDYVFDIGGVYDASRNRFDHHQTGGAGKRPVPSGSEGENTIPYSSFGLVWKHFGEEISGSSEVARRIDVYIVQPIDAGDNGVDIWKPVFPGLLPYVINNAFSAFLPSALEEINKDAEFLKMVKWAKQILKREVKKKSDEIEIQKIIQNIYRNSPDKRLIVIEDPKVSRYEIWSALQDFTEPLFIVYRGADHTWNTVAMRSDMGSYENRKDFPKEWAGLKDEELQKVSGVPDAVFCHNKLFLASAKSKEGAIKLAQLALEN